MVEIKPEGVNQTQADQQKVDDSPKTQRDVNGREIPQLTEYQQKLAQAWAESHHGAPAPFMLGPSGTGLQWVNRKLRRAMGKGKRK